MAYLVLARKYRPERFADMVGQEHVTRTLTNALNNNRLHHAYLFCGVRGLGKTTAARILAKCLVCEQGPTMEPCNVCQQCRGVTEGRSADVIEIDGASNNSVDDIRSLREKVHYLPQSARRKIYIIDEVHMLTASAFNALLKTLEEPPPHVTFLFATTDPHKVLPTILSRVSRLDFRPASIECLVDHMRHVLEQEHVHVHDDGLRIVARCADGSIRDALTLLDKVIAFAEDPKAVSEAEVQTILGQADRFAVAELIDAIFAREPALTLQRFAELCQRAHNLPRLAVAILQHLRDLAVVKACQGTTGLLDVGESLRARLVEQANGLDAIVIAQHFDRFAHTVDGLDEAKAPRLAIEMALLELVQTEPLVPIGDIVAQLRSLAGDGRPSSVRDPSGGPGSGSTGARSSGSRSPSGATHSPSNRAADPAPPAADAPTPNATTQPPNVAVDLPPAPVHTEQRSESAKTISGDASPPTPSPIDEPLPPPANSALADQLWQMVAGARVQSSTVNTSGPADKQTDIASNLPVPPLRATETTAASPSPSPTPAAPSSTSVPTPPALAAASTATEDPASCASPRCVPAKRVAWREMEPLAAWDAFLDRVADEEELLYALLVDAGFGGFHDSKLVLAILAGSMARRQLGEIEVTARLEELMLRYLGQSLELEFVDSAPALEAMPSLAQLRRHRDEQHRAELEREARAHPGIRRLLDQFGGSIRTVNPASSLPA